MKIIPLDKAHLEDAINLATNVFPYEEGQETPKFAFKTSLEPKQNEQLLKEKDLTYLEYFLLCDDKDRVIGTTGFYAFDESKDTVWLGWFCIDQDFRGKGYGKYLLDWTVKEAQRRKYKTMRLYTSDHPNEATAQFLYESFGFATYKTEKTNSKDETVVIFKEKKLDPLNP